MYHLVNPLLLLDIILQGIENMKLQDVIDVLNLFRGSRTYAKANSITTELILHLSFRVDVDKVQHRFLQSFKGNFKDFSKYVAAINDKDWNSKMKFVEWAGNRTEDYVDAIRKNHVSMEDAGMENSFFFF